MDLASEVRNSGGTTRDGVEGGTDGNGGAATDVEPACGPCC